MATEVTKTVPENTEKEKELKEETTVDNGQTKEDAPPEKTEEKADEKKAEPPAPKPTVHKANYEKDVVYLYQFSRTPLLPSTSPYCLKVETWLRLAGIKYENVPHMAKFRSKKGQLPFVELNGEEIADSTFIIKELSEKYNKDLDAALTAEQRVVAHAMISMIENHLSWVILWWRAKYPDSVIKGYQVNLQSALNTRLPNPILNFCYKFTSGRKGMKKAKAHGIGVHSQDEIIEFGKNDLRVLSDYLSDRPFFFGDEPTLLDVVAFSNLAQLQFIDKDVSHPLRDAMNESFPNLVGLVSRIKERAFTDWEDICATLDLNAHLPKPVKEAKEAKDKDKEAKDKDKEGTGPAEKQPLPEEPEKGKGDEKEKEMEKEPEEKEDKDEKEK
ncbi:failed axon connections [Ostrinia furnacalis]|uniref:failed axon connections n=1 Tax=Ostrinia furnacalis TaxID=93504 RepID=UPI00103DADE2|nr:failed axon connections [Ostrinia furnacalis]